MVYLHPTICIYRSQCSVFRPWQGWTSLSKTGPNEGTLRVLPMLSLATAYIILRPFFRQKSSLEPSLRLEDWELDLSSTTFPGAAFGKGLEPSEKLHPHLRLDKTMVSIPTVEPGDQVYCELFIHLSRTNANASQSLTIAKGIVTLYMLLNISTKVKVTRRYYIFRPCL